MIKCLHCKHLIKTDTKKFCAKAKNTPINITNNEETPLWCPRRMKK